MYFGIQERLEAKINESQEKKCLDFMVLYPEEIS